MSSRAVLAAICMIACGPTDVGRGRSPVERSTPSVVAAAARCPIRQLALGDTHVCALTEDHRVFCAGENGWGQLGDGTRTPRNTPVEVVGARGAVAIVGGVSRTCAHFTDRSWKCWGRNFERADHVAFWTESDDPRMPRSFPLDDDGEPSEILTPTPVPRLSALRSMATGDTHQCGIEEDGSVACWGENGWGQLGQSNTSIIRGTPDRVAGISHVVEVSLAMYTTCARLADGTVSCWGQYQHLGATEPTTRLAPQPIAPLTHIVQIAVGSQHACALRADGTVACWGKNIAGGLGDGTQATRAAPVNVVGLHDAVQIAVGMGYGCARHRDGTVSCWGYNADGQLGDGTIVDRTSPVRVSDIADAIDVRACGTRTCVLRADRRAFCFGRNENTPPGQRGLSTPTLLALPCQ
jgi:hypothetical protein